ncbi:hypothetical protein V8C34DRAFT_266288 [Trichoderma compactum]
MSIETANNRASSKEDKRIAHLSCHPCASAQSLAGRGNEEPCQQEDSQSARHLGISSGPCRTLTHTASGKANRDDTETLAHPRLYHPPRGYLPTAACIYYV